MNVIRRLPLPALLALSLVPVSAAGCYVESRPPPPRQPVYEQAPPPPAPPPPVTEAPPPPAPLPPAQTEVVVESEPPPPPPPEQEVVPPPPGPEFVWVAGVHRWDGRRYVWERGRYERRPHPRARWVGAHWERRARGHAWIAGHWE
jgi:hypothetical protein